MRFKEQPDYLKNIFTEQGHHYTDGWDYYSVGFLTEIQLDLKVALNGVPLEFREGAMSYDRDFLNSQNTPSVLTKPPAPSRDSDTQTAEAETQIPAPKIITQNSVSTNTSAPPARTHIRGSSNRHQRRPSIYVHGGSNSNRETSSPPPTRNLRWLYHPESSEG